MRYNDAKFALRPDLPAAPSGAQAGTQLSAYTAQPGAPLVNVNLELSRRMLALSVRQRALQLPRLLQDVCASSVERQASNLLLLDNLEILFDVKLKHDPLRLLQGLSRNKTIVAAWPGEIRTEHRGLMTESSANIDSALSTQSSALYLTYAVPDHPEYRRYLIRDFLVASPEVTT